MTKPVLVYGVGVAGTATIDFLVKRNIDVVAIDDHASANKNQALRDLGIDVREISSPAQLRNLVANCDYVAPAPGIPETHAVIVEALLLGVDIKTELDIAYEWESRRAGGPRPMLAVTGTDGKTTTVLMAESILQAAGRRTIACGNTETPLVAALDMDVDSFVVEATSFRLAFIESFRAEASAWLNFDADHLDWHRSMQTYENAKARLWRNVRPTDTAIGCADDEVVARHLRDTACRKILVAGSNNDGDYRNQSGVLASPNGPIMPVARLRRSLPHDISNALVASALCLESGLATVDEVASGLEGFTSPHHRIELVGRRDGVAWYDDSKATTPHAVRTALRGFESVVLIAGGRNKGLDLSQIATEGDRVKSVVAIGESADLVARVFAGKCPVDIADSMESAVEKAARVSVEGDIVLLSPGCTSFDWYANYSERGDHFARLVRQLISSSTSTGERP